MTSSKVSLGEDADKITIKIFNIKELKFQVRRYISELTYRRTQSPTVEYSNNMPNQPQPQSHKYTI